MAIDVNKVYTTVLSIINKKGSGYLTPDNFNKIAKTVQLELLDRAFYEYNRAVARQTGGRGAQGYGDIPRKIQDTIRKKQQQEWTTSSAIAPLTTIKNLGNEGIKLLHELALGQDTINLMQDELMKEYGSADVNLTDGTINWPKENPGSNGVEKSKEDEK